MTEGRPSRGSPDSSEGSGPRSGAKETAQSERRDAKPLSNLKAMMLPAGAASTPAEPQLPSIHAPAPLPSLGAPAPPSAVTTDAAAPSAPEAAQLWSGRLRVHEEVGRGAMGYVLRATDTKLRRDLALKVSPRPRDELSREQLARFVEEAQITAQLEHPNVVPVHDIGLDPDGRVYFSMKLIKGRSLEAIFDALKEGDPDTVAQFGLRRLLDVFLQACRAVEYAHARGVIHRDLKPANIMVGDFGEVLVMDWGVAKLVGRPDPPPAPEPPAESSGSSPDDSSPRISIPAFTPTQSVFSIRAGHQVLATKFGTVIGTPAYMSPEQADGKSVDEKTDVYSLGVILYQMLCGEVPFEHDNPQVVLALAMTEPPLPPSEVNPAAPRGLEALTLRLLEKKPENRTLTIQQIRGHIQDYVEGFGHDYRKESVWRNLVSLGGALGFFAFLVWYLTGQSIRAVLALAPPSVFNAAGWFLLVLSLRYPLWAVTAAFTHRRAEHDRFRAPSEEEIFISGFTAHRTFAAAVAPAFQLIFVVELATVAVGQATSRAPSSGFLALMVGHINAGWANALISILVFLFAYLVFLSAEVRFARRIDRYALFVRRPGWESTWPVFLILVLLLSILATGILDWVLTNGRFDPLRFVWERVLTERLNPFEIVKTLVFQGTFLFGLAGGALLISFPFPEVLAALRLPYQPADEASVIGRQQYFLRSMAFFRMAREIWLYGGAMIGCLTAITLLTQTHRGPLVEQVVYISGPSLIGFAGYWLARRYMTGYLAHAPAVEHLVNRRAVEARAEQLRINQVMVRATAWQTRLAEFVVPFACVFFYLVWTGSGVGERAIRELVLPVSTKGWLLILPYALLVPVLIGRDAIQAWFARRSAS